MSIFERVLQAGAMGALQVLFLGSVLAVVGIASRSRFNKKFSKGTSYAILLTAMGGLILLYCLMK